MKRPKTSKKLVVLLLCLTLLPGIGLNTASAQTQPSNTFNLEGTVFWDDDNDDAGERPDSITLTLTATVNGSSSTYDGQPTWIYDYAENTWYFVYNNLPIKDANGNLIAYEITASETGNYDTTITETNEIIYFIDDYTKITPCNTTTFPDIGLPYYIVSKLTGNEWAVWTENPLETEQQKLNFIDSYNAIAGSELDLPNNLTNITFRDGVIPPYQEGFGMTYNSTENSWTLVFEHTSVWAMWAYGGYSAQIVKFSITKTYNPSLIDFTVDKTWDDNNNQDGIRPASVEVQLYKDSAAFGAPVTLNAGNSWEYKWEDLKEYYKGNPINYTVAETSVPNGYTAGYDYGDNSCTITNTHASAVTSVTVNKIWDDDGDRDGVRPESVQLQLYANGTASGEAVTVSGSGDQWSYTWSNLPAKANGQDITYTVQESGDPGEYAVSISGFTITNTYTPGETSRTVTKIWNDNNNQDGKRPAGVTVQLKADGEAYGEAVTLNSSNEWAHTWNNLPVYRDGGQAISYSVVETSDAGEYAVSVDGFTITNSYTPGETNRTVTKIWNDNNNLDGKRPAGVTVQLKADGEDSGEPVTLNEENDWTHTWTGLPLKTGGEAIAYTVQEISAIAGYTTSYSNGTFTITNTLNAGPAITIDKTGPTSARRGNTITYSFTVTNSGNVTLTGIVVTDPILGEGWSHDVGTLNPGNSTSFTANYVIPGTASGTITNTATVTGNYGDNPVTDNDSHSVAITTGGGGGGGTVVIPPEEPTVPPVEPTTPPEEPGEVIVPPEEPTTEPEVIIPPEEPKAQPEEEKLPYTGADANVLLGLLMGVILAGSGLFFLKKSRVK